MKFNRSLAVALAAASLFAAGRAFADADSAKKYLQSAKDEVANNDLDKANNDIMLAETELDGVDAAAKDPIAKDIATLKQSIADSKNAGAKDLITKQIEQLMSDTKSTLDSKQSFDEQDKAVQDFLAKDDVKQALGADAVAKYLKTLSTFRKVATINGFNRNLAQVKDLLDSAEKEWPDKLKAMQNSANEPGDADMAATDFGHTLDRIEPFVRDFPRDKPEAVTQIDRFKKLQTGYNAQMAQAKAGEAFDSMKRYWDGYADDFKGWDTENTGPSFDDILHNQGDEMSALKAPKTVAMIRRANSWFDDEMKNETVAALKDTDPKIKGMFDDMKATRQKAWAKMETFASAILDQAEKTEINKESRDRLEQLANDDLRLDIEGSPHLAMLQERSLKMVKAFDAKTVGDQAARDKLYNSLVDQGNKAWPDLVKKADASENFDANAVFQKVDDFKGKSFIFKGVKNRMGWDYNPSSGYQFALTIDSIPVCAKMEPGVAKAFNIVQGKTGKDFTDDNYDVIAEVEGIGPVIKIARAEGDLKTTGGEKVGTYTAQEDQTVQSIRMKITAIHVGPFTAGGQGVLDENGSFNNP